MKKITVLLTALTLMLFANVAVQAQPPGGGGPPSAEEMVEKLMTDLSKEITLTDAEKSSLEEIFTDFHTEMEKMHKSGSRPDRSAMEKLESERDEKVKEVLSEENYEAYAKFMEDFMKPPEGQGPPPPQN